MKFKYTARTKTGEMQAGFVEAFNREAAVNILNSHNLYLLNIESEEPKIGSQFFAFLKRVRRKDVTIFTRQFATLLEAEIPLTDALKTLYVQTPNAALKETIFEVSSDIDAGLSLSQALERHAGVFSDFYINLIRSAEVTGRVQESLVFLADYLEKDYILISKVRNAMIYPAFIGVIFIVVIIVLLTVVFPQLKPIFEESGTEIPFLTKILLNSGDFFLHNWLIVTLVLGGAIFGLVSYMRTKEGKAAFNELLLRTPFLGKLFVKVYVARFTQSAQILIKGGIPVVQAMEISGQTADSLVYRDALHEVAEAVKRGELLSRALSVRSDLFPPLVSQMAAVGENTGRLDQMMDRIATFYTREVDSLVSNLVELIQPAIMVVIGLMVGLLFAAVLIPIYNLSQGF